MGHINLSYQNFQVLVSTYLPLWKVALLFETFNSYLFQVTDTPGLLRRHDGERLPFIFPD